VCRKIQTHGTSTVIIVRSLDRSQDMGRRSLPYNSVGCLACLVGADAVATYVGATCAAATWWSFGIGCVVAGAIVLEFSGDEGCLFSSVCCPIYVISYPTALLSWE
jgi:hypothetical protein